MADATVQDVYVVGNRWAFETNTVVFGAGDSACNVLGNIPSLQTDYRDVLIRGITTCYTHAGGAVRVGMIVNSYPGLSHWLEVKTMPVAAGICYNWSPLDIPCRLSPSVAIVGGWLLDTTAAGDTMIISAWGEFIEQQKETPAPVRFVAPQTVSVEGVKLWSRR